MSFRNLIPFVAMVLLSCSGDASDAPLTDAPQDAPEPQPSSVPANEDLPQTADPVVANAPTETTEPELAPSEATEPELAPEVAPMRPPGDGDVLVWMRRTPSFTARLDGTTGAIVETIPDIQIAAGGRVWTLASEEKVLTIAKPCDPEREEESSTTRLTLTSGHDVRELEPFFVEPDTDGFVQIKQEAELIASVGPYAFVRTWVYTDGCGAHGSVGARAHVVDVVSGADVDLAAELGPELELAREALGKIEDRFDDELPRRTELLPQIGEDGRLHLGRKFTAFACYACSDGEWSSYSRSIVLSAPKLPRSLAPFATLPKALTRFHAEHPTSKIGGFSIIAR